MQDERAPREAVASSGSPRLTAIRPAHFPWYDHARYTFSLGLELDGAVMLSGHSGSRFDAATARIDVPGDLREQAQTAFDKIGVILAAAGYGFGDVVHVVEYVTPTALRDYPVVAQVRQEYVASSASISSVAVNRLVREQALIEIEVVARRGGGGPLHDLVFLPGLSVPRGGDVAAQLSSVYRQTLGALQQLGLDGDHVVRVSEFLVPDAVDLYPRLAAARQAHFGDSPSVTSVTFEQLADARAAAQLEVIASRSARVPLGSGAIRAGRVAFVSAQAAAAPVGHPPGELRAQADWLYAGLARDCAAMQDDSSAIWHTVEYVAASAVAEYRHVAKVRQAHLGRPYPAATGVVCEAFPRSKFLLEVAAMVLVNGR